MNKKPKKITLDAEEQEIENNFEKMTTFSPAEKIKKMAIYKEAAKNYFKKGKKITVRVFESDLERIKILAAEEGLPYDMYITSMLHKLSTGRLKDTYR